MVSIAQCWAQVRLLLGRVPAPTEAEAAAGKVLSAAREWVANGGGGDHAALSNVTANQHHAQAHTLTSHSTRTHSELTSVGANDHHAQAHEAAHITGGADLIPVADATHTGLVPAIPADATKYLDGTGAWTVPAGAIATMAVMAYNNAAISVANNSWVPLTLNSEDYDVGGLHSTASDTERITIPSGGAGWYMLSGDAQFAANATGARKLRIVLNGVGTTGVLAIASTPQQADITDNDQVNVTTICKLADGDYVELQAFQRSGGALNVQYDGGGAHYSPSFRAVRVCAAA